MKLLYMEFLHVILNLFTYFFTTESSEADSITPYVGMLHQQLVRMKMHDNFINVYCFLDNH